MQPVTASSSALPSTAPISPGRPIAVAAITSSTGPKADDDADEGQCRRQPVQVRRLVLLLPGGEKRVQAQPHHHVGAEAPRGKKRASPARSVVVHGSAKGWLFGVP